MKYCPRCGDLKSNDEFARAKGSPDGRQPWCRTCFSEYQRSRKRKEKEQAQRAAGLRTVEEWREVLRNAADRLGLL